MLLVHSKTCDIYLIKGQKNLYKNRSIDLKHGRQTLTPGEINKVVIEKEKRHKERN